MPQERPIDPKRMLKRGLQLLVSKVAPERWYFPYRSLLVLMYHRILSDDHPDLHLMQPGMVVRAKSFEMQLQLLAKHFNVLPLSEWIGRIRTGRAIPPRACAITLDDGWRDNYEIAFPLLQRHGLPASLFLVSDYVETDRHFWPERLAFALQEAERQGEERWGAREFHWLRERGVSRTSSADQAITAVKALADSEIVDRVAAMEALLKIDRLERRRHLLDWTQAREMAASGLIEIGSHTRNHFRLGRALSDDAERDEIVTSKRLIEERLGTNVKLFCYPNGEFSSRAERLVRENYAAALLTRRGWNMPEQDHYRLRRIAIHEGVGGDEAAFLARLSGWI